MRPCVISITLAVFAARTAAAQDRYLDPPEPIARILDQPQTPFVSLSPNRQWLLILSRPSLPGIREVAAPDLRLAGIRIDPASNGSSRATVFTGVLLRAVNGSTERTVQVPQNARIGNVSWAPGSATLAFTVTTDRGIELWAAESATGTTRRLLGPVLNGTTGSPCEWVDAGSLLCRTVPPSRGSPPQRSPIPTAPIIQESEGRVAPNRTYEDLLKDPHDEALFDFYFTSQLTVVTLTGTASPVGPAAVYPVALPSPDGRYFLISALHRPYSYLVPGGRFPERTEIWDREGKTVRVIRDRSLQEEVSPSFDAVPIGPRALQWREDAPSTAVWVEAADGGDPKQSAEVRDRVFSLAPPFAGEPVEVASLGYRLDDITWGPSGTALVSESWTRSRRSRTWLVGAGKPRLLFDRSSEDTYGDPGRFLTRTTASGARVLLTSADGQSAFLAGLGASPEGDRPFLDQYALATGKTARLWRSEAPYFEGVVGVVDPDARLVVTQRESVNDPPNFFLRDLRHSRLTRLTDLKDPAPEFAGVTSELITYPRADGVQLSATLYLPPGYDKSKGPLPFFFWAYPREFKTAAAAAQVIGSPYRFTRPTGASHLFLLLAGYGVLDGPTMPIVGEGDKEPNDTYVTQLVSSAEAAVNKVVAMGVADRKRIGIGGHSYGAFMTANLLAHSDLFRAGVARSGAYNRTLTPFGFQAEERTYWQAMDIYSTMSPFTFADRIKAPLLLIHGQDDDNSGTFPIQSERMYAALKGNGAKVRLVFLPGEAHGYRARESVGHTLREMIDWLDRYVKGAASLTP